MIWNLLWIAYVIAVLFCFFGFRYVIVPLFLLLNRKHAEISRDDGESEELREVREGGENSL